MNAFNGVAAERDPLEVFKIGVLRGVEHLGGATDAAAKNAQALQRSFGAAAKAAEQIRAYAAAQAANALEQQIAAASAFAKVKSPKEMLELQSAFARRALEGYGASFAAAQDLLQASVTATWQPIQDRYREAMEQSKMF